MTESDQAYPDRTPDERETNQPVGAGRSSSSPDCDLCEAARITPWFYEDDDCWIAECEFCNVPMVVWKRHDPSPPAAVRELLHARLGDVVRDHFEYVHWVDDNMRNIPDHYHAHARRRGGSVSR